MEMHSIYTGGIATEEFATARIEAPIGELRLMVDELQMMIDGEVVPPGNLFFRTICYPLKNAFSSIPAR